MNNADQPARSTSSGKTDVDAIAEALGLVDYAEGQGPHYGSASECLARIAEMKARHDLISRRENELHYAIRRDANILDHKLTEEQAHQTALKRVDTMYAELEMFHLLAKESRRG